MQAPTPDQLARMSNHALKAVIAQQIDTTVKIKTGATQMDVPTLESFVCVRRAYNKELRRRVQDMVDRGVGSETEAFKCALAVLEKYS
jgi:hypothetical protein